MHELTENGGRKMGKLPRKANHSLTFAGFLRYCSYELSDLRPGRTAILTQAPERHLRSAKRDTLRARGKNTHSELTAFTCVANLQFFSRYLNFENSFYHNTTMKILRVPDFKSFNELYSKYEQKKDSENLKNLLMLFIASDDPQTRESWCSDCRNCKSIMDNQIEEFKFNEQLTLAIVEVGHRDEWKKSDNPFRTHKVQVTGVPTLLSLTTVSFQL